MAEVGSECPLLDARLFDPLGCVQHLRLRYVSSIILTSRIPQQASLCPDRGADQGRKGNSGRVLPMPPVQSFLNLMLEGVEMVWD